MSEAHPQTDLVASYALGALPEEERVDFEAHVASCATCAHELAQDRAVTGALALSGPPVRAPRDLRSRVLAVVESEAELLRAAGPAADRPPRRRFGFGPLQLSPRGAMVATAAAVVAMVGGWTARDLLQGDGVSHRTVALSAPAGHGAQARVDLVGERSTLHVSRMPAPGVGRTYQVWLQPSSNAAPEGTQTSFFVDRDGTAAVDLPAGARRAYRVLVSSEPAGGSPTGTPSRQPVVVGSL